jgi:hypothetical protein
MPSASEYARFPHCAFVTLHQYGSVIPYITHLGRPVQRILRSPAKGVPPDLPVGGINDSSYGYEGGTEGLRTFQTLKMISARHEQGLCPR